MSHDDSMVFVVDDDESVRRALSRLLRSAGYCVESHASALSFLESRSVIHGPACLVLDVGLPGLDGLALQRKLNDTHTSLPIVFITGGGDIAMTVCAMKAGASDFLAKPVGEADLLRAVELALQRAGQALASRTELNAINARMARLTPREREVLALLVEGRINKQVACQLGIAEKTIKVHRARLMEKMEIRTLVELVRVTDKLGTRSSHAHAWPS
jgi:FixJ family two-component response regulator